MAAEGEVSVSNKNLRFQQGAHVVAGGVVLAAALWVLPREGELATLLLNMAYVLAFGLSFGVQCWMTFVNGVTIIRILPRPWFGAVQSRLFPRYFLITLTASAVMLGVTVARHPDWARWSTARTAEVAGVSVTLACSLVQLLYAVPYSVQLMTRMYDMEKEAGITDAVGGLPDGALRDNAAYVALRRRFIGVHGVSALSNLVTIACALFPAYHLASQMQ